MLGYNGLYLAYQKLGMKDSAMKYVELYSCANDSTNVFESADRLQRMQSLYNYEHALREADRIRQSAYRREALLWLLVGAVIVTASFVVLLMAFRFERKHEKESKALQKVNQEYSNTLLLYYKAKEELGLLSEQNMSNMQLLEAKEKELQNYRQQLADFLSGKSESEELRQLDDANLRSDFILKLHKQASVGGSASDLDVQKVMEFVNLHYPNFFQNV